ncbi:hypothetical protein BSZ35_19105 [Salinibacter sp. 10B]|uniref:hypothetical protein n=1 Tax=Salinibacter sp. 10B TaxID=1923971 RepID=UPI000CF3ED49|nr:hypothetical protein [Salinibacter sp. 10B]PQJ26758.1 hypothetical protein BSZ35_19105 [Salinibacter sp. 10B]
MQLELEDDELNQLADRIADRLFSRLTSEGGGALVQSDDGTIHGIDPHRLYTAAQVADRWSVSKKTVRRNLERTEWDGNGVRYRGIDILRYEGLDVEASREDSASKTSSAASEAETESGQQYCGTLPEL